MSGEEKKPEQAQNVNVNLGEEILGVRYERVTCFLAALVGAGLAKMKNMRGSSSNDSESDAWSSD